MDFGLITDLHMDHGRYVGVPAGWSSFTEERIEAFELDMENGSSGSPVTMAATIQGAIQRGEPPQNPTRIMQASIASDNRPQPSMQALPPIRAMRWARNRSCSRCSMKAPRS